MKKLLCNKLFLLLILQKKYNFDSKNFDSKHFDSKNERKDFAFRNLSEI